MIEYNREQECILLTLPSFLHLPLCPKRQWHAYYTHNWLVTPTTHHLPSHRDETIPKQLFHSISNKLMTAPRKHTSTKLCQHFHIFGHRGGDSIGSNSILCMNFCSVPHISHKTMYFHFIKTSPNSNPSSYHIHQHHSSQRYSLHRHRQNPTLPLPYPNHLIIILYVRSLYFGR